MASTVGGDKTPKALLRKVKSIVGWSPSRTKWCYDQAGNRTELFFLSRDVRSWPDALGRLAWVELDYAYNIEYQFIGSRVARRTYSTSPNTTYYDITYNNLGQATERHTYKTGLNVADFTYTYDANGNITQEDFRHRPANQGWPYRNGRTTELRSLHELLPGASLFVLNLNTNAFTYLTSPGTAASYYPNYLAWCSTKTAIIQDRPQWHGHAVRLHQAGAG
jgi:hypothetical protein